VPREAHFIERLNHFKPVDKARNIWESGWWAISPGTADQLVGGSLFLHKKQTEPSFFGGLITAFRTETEGEWPGRIVFTFISRAEEKGVKTPKKGWSMEKKIILEDA